MDRPLRIVGERMDNLQGESRRSVVLQTRHHMVVLCNARWVKSLNAMRCALRQH